MTDFRQHFKITPPYGTYRPNKFRRILICITRNLPENWLGLRLMFLFRRLATFGASKKVDTELFGFPMRLRSSGNVSEKRALFAPQFFDSQERQVIASLASDKAVFIDIGSNMALYSFSAAAAFKNFKNTRILAIEPHPIISRRLAFNLSLNPQLPIEQITVGLAKQDGREKIISPTSNLGESRLLKKNDAVVDEIYEVQVKTLMNLLKEKRINRIDGIKIDIEGHEEIVLAPFLKEAPENLLPRVIIIENNCLKWEEDLIALAENRGYTDKTNTRNNIILRKVKN